MSERSAAAHWALCLVLLASVGCRSSEARQLEAEVARLGRHIDGLRNAPNEAKALLLASLRGAPCETEPGCGLRDLCARAYERHLAAVEASARARSALADPDGGTGASLAAAQYLSRAEFELEEAKELGGRCASVQGELLRSARER